MNKSTCSFSDDDKHYSEKNIMAKGLLRYINDVE